MNPVILLRALEFAAHKHRAQCRKSGERVPYIKHPIEVARILAEVGGVDDVDVLSAAVLHDTLEDTDTTREELLAAFGPTITGLVAEVTDDKSLPSRERKRLQVVHAPHKSPGAALIKLADKSANVGDLGEEPPPDWTAQRIRDYFDWAESVVAALPKVNDALRVHFERTLRESRKRREEVSGE